MTATWTAYQSAVTLAPGKTMLGIWNASSSLTVKVKRIYALANCNSYYEFRETAFVVRKSTAYNGGRLIEATTHDSNNGTLSSDVKIVIGGEWTDIGVITRRPMSAYYASGSGAVWPIMGEAHPPLAVLWDFGLKSGLQPITLHQNEGLRIINFGLTDQGEYDMAIEFTVE